LMYFFGSSPTTCNWRADKLVEVKYNVTKKTYYVFPIEHGT
jgi:hypothetical protein